jgi:hypothetical protein
MPPKAASKPFRIEELNTVFTLDAVNGILYRNSTGRPAYIQWKSDWGKLRGWVVVKGRREVAVHRVIWAMHTGAWPELSIDHIDGDTKNNAIHNLREVTTAINSRNTKLYDSNTSGFIGVTCTTSGKWRARIGYDGGRICLGSFDTPEEAYAAYRAEATRLGFHDNHGRDER